jgi:hypothetical protein
VHCYNRGPKSTEERTLNISAVVSELKAERNRLDAAINALESVWSNGSGGPKTRRISAAGRRRIIEAQKKRWAKIHRAKKG